MRNRHDDQINTPKQRKIALRAKWPEQSGKQYNIRKFNTLLRLKICEYKLRVKNKIVAFREKLLEILTLEIS